jgi:hypothetical protein
MAVRPTTPTDDAQQRIGSVREDREKLELVAVRVVEVEGGCWHPREYNWLPSRIP